MKEVDFPKQITRRTKSIWYEGCKYNRSCEYHSRWCYIVGWFGVSKAQIEIDGKQYIVDVDDAEFKLTEYTKC